MSSSSTILNTNSSSRSINSSFWKYVTKQIEKALKKSEIVFVSTHWKDIPYLHVRIECFPKNHFVYKKQYLQRQGCNEYQTKKCTLR